MLGVLKKGLSTSTTLSCPSAQFVWSTNLRTVGNGPSCSGNLYVRYSELRNESQGDSRKRFAGESLPDNFIKFMITDAEKSRPEQKSSEPKAKKNKEEKPQKDFLSRLDYFELPESDIPLKFAPCINGVKQAKLSCN